MTWRRLTGSAFAGLAAYYLAAAAGAPGWTLWVAGDCCDIATFTFIACWMLSKPPV